MAPVAWLHPSRTGAPQETARSVAEVSRECKLEVVVDDYVESFKPFLMDIMYSWSKGASFRDVCLMTGGRGGMRAARFSGYVNIVKDWVGEGGREGPRERERVTCLNLLIDRASYDLI